MTHDDIAQTALQETLDAIIAMHTPYINAERAIHCTNECDRWVDYDDDADPCDTLIAAIGEDNAKAAYAKVKGERQAVFDAQAEKRRRMDAFRNRVFNGAVTIQTAADVEDAAATFGHVPNIGDTVRYVAPRAAEFEWLKA